MLRRVLAEVVCESRSLASTRPGTFDTKGMQGDEGRETAYNTPICTPLTTNIEPSSVADEPEEDGYEADASDIENAAIHVATPVRLVNAAEGRIIQLRHQHQYAPYFSPLYTSFYVSDSEDSNDEYTCSQQPEAKPELEMLKPVAFVPPHGCQLLSPLLIPAHPTRPAPALPRPMVSETVEQDLFADWTGTFPAPESWPSEKTSSEEDEENELQILAPLVYVQPHGFAVIDSATNLPVDGPLLSSAVRGREDDWFDGWPETFVPDNEMEGESNPFSTTFHSPDSPRSNFAIFARTPSVSTTSAPADDEESEGDVIDTFIHGLLAQALPIHPRPIRTNTGISHSGIVLLPPSPLPPSLAGAESDAMEVLEQVEMMSSEEEEYVSVDMVSLTPLVVSPPVSNRRVSGRRRLRKRAGLRLEVEMVKERGGRERVRDAWRVVKALGKRCFGGRTEGGKM